MSPHLDFHQGDNRDILRRMIDEGMRVHSIVTDPPYGLVSIQKRFGSKTAAPARREGNDGSFARLSGGFVGQEWDGTEIERDPEFWRLCHDILLPGGLCYAFSGSRTCHWQGVAMEMAGFVMHPMHGWLYGTGFPKAHNAAKAVASAGGDPEPWRGWAYGTQTQKPAMEPIFLGQRPFSEKSGGANLVKHGVGAMNVDGCRVPTDENLNGGAYAKDPSERDQMWGAEAGNSWRRGGAGEYVQPEGRYPANLLHDGSKEAASLFPGDGEASAARFFNSYPLDEVAAYHGLAIGHYHAKAGEADRAGSDHPTVKPIGLLRHLIRHITPPGGVVLDPFGGTGTTAEAAKLEGVDCILIEKHEPYADFIRQRFDLPTDAEISDIEALI